MELRVPIRPEEAQQFSSPGQRPGTRFARNQYQPCKGDAVAILRPGAVSPFQGMRNWWPLIPRALPWAWELCRPFGPKAWQIRWCYKGPDPTLVFSHRWSDASGPPTTARLRPALHISRRPAKSLCWSLKKSTQQGVDISSCGGSNDLSDTKHTPSHQMTRNDGQDGHGCHGKVIKLARVDQGG